MKRNTKYTAILCILAVVMVVAMLFAFTACETPNTPDTPDTSSCDCTDCNCANCPDCDCENCSCSKSDEPVTYKVTVVSLKTWTKTVESGTTLEQYKSELNMNPTKSGEKFVGWYEDGATTPYDWSTPITKNTTIRARFEKIEGLTVKNGTAFPTADNGFTTGSADTLYTYGTFEKGSFTVNVTPTKAGNDCGVIFGAEESATGTWEDFSYYTLLINKRGFMLLATPNPWTDVCPGVDLTSVGITYSTDATYKLTVKYSGNEDQYLECYVNDKLVMSTTLKDGFYGNVVGCRAAVDGTVFGAMTFDATDLPQVPETDIGGYLLRSGTIEVAEGTIKTTIGSTLAIAKDKTMGNAISYTMKRNGTNGCDGIVFALTDNAPSYWESGNTSYYFLFVDENGNVRLSKIVGGWDEEGRAGVHVDAQDGKYRFDVVTIGTEVRMFANGVQCFKISNALTGTAYGIRAQLVGVEYVENDLSGKVAVVIEGATTELKYVDSGSALTSIKPADPTKDGYDFKGWVTAGTTTAFDWNATVSANVAVSANFEVAQTAKYITTQGSVEESDFGYKTKSADTLFILNGKTFNGGSVEVTLKHNDKTANDIAFIFGANVTEGATWENFDYYVAMINFNGTILFAKVNGWNVLASSAILESGYDPAQAYTLKIFYTDGYVRIYAKGANVTDYTLALTSYVGELKGTSIGFRAQKAGTEFGSTVTIDANDNLTISANTNVELTARCGGVDKDENGVFTTTGDGNGNFLAVSNTALSAGGCITVKMTRTAGDTGVVFGFSGTEPWEGTNTYQMLFIDDNGSVRVASFPWHQWYESTEAIKNTATAEHTLTISYDAHGIVCHVDGVMYGVTDTIKPTGELLFGIRGKEGVTYSDWSVVDYSQITDSITTK